MTLLMDAAYAKAKTVIYDENYRAVSEALLRAYGKRKGQTILDGLFPERAGESERR
jgi:hypothetical protein